MTYIHKCELLRAEMINPKTRFIINFITSQKTKLSLEKFFGFPLHFSNEARNRDRIIHINPKKQGHSESHLFL